MTDEGPWHRLPVSSWSDHAFSANPQTRARETRRDLLLAASLRFAAEGYHETSLTKVVSDTGCTKGAFYYHFRSKVELGRAVVDELHASWDDIVHRITARGLDPLQTLLVVYDAQIARLMHDPIVRGGLRVIREQPEIQAERHKWVAEWRAESATLLELAHERRLLVSAADPEAISTTLLATVVGHHQLAEAQPSGPTTWERMTTSWLGLLPAIVDGEWLRRWSLSGWLTRPSPTRQQYEQARKPTATLPVGTDTVEAQPRPDH